MNHHPSKADTTESHNENYRFNINLLFPTSPPERNRSIPSQFLRTRNASRHSLLTTLTEAIEITDPLLAFIRAESCTSGQVHQLPSSSSITTTGTSAPRPRGRFIAPGMDAKRRRTNETSPEKDPQWNDEHTLYILIHTFFTEALDRFE